jgi:predicted DsbA family dithiol-disulfide isomerase
VIVLYFDYASPAAVLALVRLEAAAERRAVALDMVGLDPLGLDVVVPATLDQLAELERVRPHADRIGLRLTRPAERPPTARAHLVGVLADAEGRGGAWRHACIEAYWTDGRSLGDPAVLRDLADRVGLDATRVGTVLDDPMALLEARRRAAALHRRGIGGVPVLEVDGTFLPADLDDDALAAVLAVGRPAGGRVPPTGPGHPLGSAS